MSVAPIVGCVQRRRHAAPKRRDTGPTDEIKALVIARDGGCVRAAAGECFGRVVCNHRANRGMGGSRQLNRPSNLVAACFFCNGWFEDHPEEARAAGWKLRRTDDPTMVAVKYPDGRRWLLDDEGGRILLSH